AGDNPVEERTGAPYEFLSRPRWQRFLIAIAGPVTNITVTFLILWGISLFVGTLPSIIGEVQAGMPAEKAGIRPGDLIVSMDGKPISTWDGLVDEIRNSDGQAIHFVIHRDGKDVPISVTPEHLKNPEDGQVTWMVGFSRPPLKYERHGLLTAAQDAGAETLYETKQIGNVLVGLFDGKVSVHDLAGPVGIVQLSGEAAKSGPMTLLQLTALISLNLGLLNLLPIPILDGGWVLMLAIEGLLRRELSLTFKERFVQVGLVFILSVFAFVMYSDILRVIQTRGH
ncbi:MAG: RIP metalloprotease RseP, partial [Candidatus Acidiferrales bacterium]